MGYEASQVLKKPSSFMSVPNDLLKFLRERFALDWTGIHGAAHWARVRETGIRLARTTGASIPVIEYFAFLHDSCRETDGGDSEHGPRAARFAREIRQRYISLDDQEFELLIEAIKSHTGGTEATNITVATCWDADRLDLGRIDIVPDSGYLLTEAARHPETIEWAWQRSMAWREQRLRANPEIL